MTELFEKLERVESLILTTQKAVLNIDEVCILTGLSKSTIYKSTMNGTIPFYKQAKHLFFDRLEIEQWLKQTRGFNVQEAEQRAASALSIKGGVK